MESQQIPLNIKTDETRPAGSCFGPFVSDTPTAVSSLSYPRRIMDRRGFVTSGMAAGLAGITASGERLGVSSCARFSPGKRLANGDIRLSSNENPLGVSPAARDAIIEAIVESNRYGGRRREVIAALSSYVGVKPEQITLGFGSTEILQICTQAFQGPNTPLIAAAPTFEDVMDYQDTMPFGTPSLSQRISSTTFSRCGICR